jgi:hypothetical protein
MLKRVKQKILPSLQAAGTYLGSVVIHALPSEQVQAMLPEAFALAPQTMTAPGTHPVIFTFGEQMHTRLEPSFVSLEKYLAPLSHGLNLGYLQFMLIVPLLQPKQPGWSKPDSFSFMPRLYLNKRFPVLGSALYGFATQEASIGIAGNTYLINRLADNAPLITGEFKTKGRPSHPQSDFPLFERYVPQLLQSTYVGQTRLGGFTRANFDWGLAQAEIQAIKADVEISQPVVPGLTPASFHRPSIEADPLGAFRLCTAWTLSPARPCFF